MINDTIKGNGIRLNQKGHFIGIGPQVGLNYDLLPKLSVKFNLIPTYLISVGKECTDPKQPLEYSKGMWMFSIQLGFTYRILNSEK
jgi:hypothetical protein